MPEKVMPGPVEDSCGIREAVCIHTRKIFDSCRDKDCIEDLRFYPKLQCVDIINRALSVKGGSAKLLYVYVDVEPKNGENLSKGYDYTITDGDVKDMYVGTEEETYDGVKFDYMTYVTVVKDSNDHTTADLDYIIHKPVVEMVKVTLALTNATVTVNGVEYTENGSISVKKGTELNWTAKAKEGYNLTTPASGKVTANSDTTITATASADTLSVKVEGHAAANPTSITANQAADITVTAEKGYTITDVTCAQAAKIKSNGDGTWTVSVPAGTEEIAIKVTLRL